MLMVSFVEKLLNKISAETENTSFVLKDKSAQNFHIKNIILKFQESQLVKSHSIILSITLCCLLIFNSNKVICQNDTVQLKEFEVRGIRPDISTSAASPVQQLTLKRIEAIPSFSVAEAIRNFSGVVLKDYGGIGGLKTVMIRSMGSNHTAVFVDGQPASDAAAGQTDLGKIALQDVSKIQLSIGQPEFDLKSARMFASASLLEIYSKEPDFIKKKSYITLSAKSGSFGTFNPSVGIDSKINRNITTSIKANYYSANGKFPYQLTNGSIVTDLIRNNSDIVTQDAMFRTKINFNDSSTLKIKATYYHSERGLPGAVILYNNFSNQRLLNRDFISGLEYFKPFSAQLHMKISSGVSDLKLVYTDPSYHNQSGILENEYKQQEYYVSGALLYELTDHLKFSLASDIILNTLKTNAYSIHQPERISSLTAGNFIYTLKHTEIQGTLLLTAVSEIKLKSNIKNHVRLSPAISIIQSLSNDESLKARFMYKNTFRLPTFNDLYYTLAGNNNLDPENADLFNLGLIFNKAFNNTTGFNFRVDAFINQVRNKIVTVPTQNLFIWSTQNIDKAEIKGFELYADFIKQLNDNWSFDISGNYTYQEAKDVTSVSDADYGHQLAYIPFETSGGLLTVYYRNLGLGVNSLYNGFRYSSIDNNRENILKSWNTTDLTLNWKIILGKADCNIKLESANILDQHYEIIRGFPMTGRAYYIKLIVTI
jgi:outer membrane cobalamin receptor